MESRATAIPAAEPRHPIAITTIRTLVSGSRRYRQGFDALTRS